MSDRQFREFAASHDGLAEALAFVEAFCQSATVGNDDGLRLTLVVEELFTNTVEHGHGSAGTGPVSTVRLQLTAEPTRLVLHYEDEAPHFDPWQGLEQSAPVLEAPAHERPVGGLGLHLMAGLAVERGYERRGNRNRLWLVLPRRA